MENLKKRPSKGILRFSEGSSRSNSIDKDIKWDEANIQETLHPESKDYGHMKIDEPPTPYARSAKDGEASEDEDVKDRTEQLLASATKKIKEPPVTIENLEGLDESDLADLGEPTTSSPSSKTCTDSHVSLNSSACSSKSEQSFEQKRKRHYNEFHAVKLAKLLMQKDLDDDNDDSEDKDATSKKTKS